MKKILVCLALCAPLAAVQAATTIDAVNHYAYGANIGWMDWRGDTTSGAVIGEYVCSGFIYAANAGWINLGGGAPTNGVQYHNLSADDCGVNVDGGGNLRGYAYGASIGWVNFESTGAPKIDLQTGRFSGYAYSANCGWFSLSNTAACVQTDTIAPGADADHNGLPDAWELANFGHTGVDPNADPDGDRMSNRQEYLAGTNPLNAADRLYVTAISATSSGTTVTLTWKSSVGRFYYIQKTTDFSSGSWLDSGLGLVTADPGTTTTRSFTDISAGVDFYRIEVVRPLGP